MNKEIAVITIKRKTMLIKASLISRTIKILFPAKNFCGNGVNNNSPNNKNKNLLPAGGDRGTFKSYVAHSIVHGGVGEI